MAKIQPNNNSSEEKSITFKTRADSISEGTKIVTMLGFFYETSFGNKKLQIGYTILKDLNEKEDSEITEEGIIHIDSLLIRDSVMWKHEKWSGGCGYTQGYDNEDSNDIMNIIVQCPAVKVDFKSKTFQGRDGNEKTVIEIVNWQKVEGEKVDKLLADKSQLITSCETSFQKIITYREKNGNVQRPQLTSNNNDDFDNHVNQQQQWNNSTNNDEIPF